MKRRRSMLQETRGMIGISATEFPIGADGKEREFPRFESCMIKEMIIECQHL